MTKLIRTNTSSKKSRGARKVDPRKAQALAQSFDSLKDKWANVPTFSGKYTVKALTKARGQVAHTKVPQATLAPSSPRPALGKFDVGVGALPPQKTYTGNNVKGIAVMHKSCLQPIFSAEEAVDSAKMRR